MTLRSRARLRSRGARARLPLTLAAFAVAALIPSARPALADWGEVPAVEPKATMSAEQALDLLRYAQAFSTERVGLRRDVPAEAPAFWAIHQREDAADLFQSLLDAPTLAGRLYGLAGLYLTDTRAFAMVYGDYAREDRPVRSVDGAFVSLVPCADVAARIESGEAPKLILRLGEEGTELAAR